MKKVFAIIITMALILSSVPTSIALAAKPTDKIASSNGAPSGAHYNINFIAHPNVIEDEEWDGGEGSRVFISDSGQTKIYVYGGDSFAVQDRNGTDGYVGTGFGPDNAGIILPYDGGRYTCGVYVRILGPQGSSVKIKGEYYEAGELYPIGEIHLSKNGGGTKFQFANDDLLNDDYRDILWTMYDKVNYKIVQMRIYPE